MPLSTYESLPLTSNLLELEKPASELTSTLASASEVEAVLVACCLYPAAETGNATEMESCDWRREELSDRRRTWYRNVKRRQRRRRRDEK